MNDPEQTTSSKIRAASQEWGISFLAGVERRRRDALDMLLGAWSSCHLVETRVQYQGTDQ